MNDDKYNYLEAVEDDVREYIKDNVDLSDYSSKDELENYLSDELWVEDSVTGNASGSYTFSTWKAESYLCHNLDLLREALEDFGGDFSDAIDRGAEACDVIIRCYLLGIAINEVLDDLELPDNEDDEDDEDVE